MPTPLKCPKCNAVVSPYRNPIPTVDVVIEVESGGETRIVLIKRKNPPYGWALPGGFVDYGETVESAAVREAEEETGLKVTLTGLLGVYSDPNRDPRQHTITTVFTARADGVPKGLDDAEEAALFTRDDPPAPLAFDHDRILNDYFKRTGPGTR